jgi:hypothetical protein
MVKKAEKYGMNAYRVAISLLDSGMTYDQILEAAKQAPADKPNESVHRAITPNMGTMVREPTPEAEEAWLKEAREAAEAAWAKAHGWAPRKDTRSAEQIALDKQFGVIAMKAAGLYDDGQKRFRADSLDGAMFRDGEASAKRLLGK